MESRAPVIDVVIAAHDAEDTISLAIERVPSQRVRSIVVVDYGSRDRTATRAADAGAIVLRSRGGGYGAACRRAVRHFQALPKAPDIVVFLSQDAAEEPSTVERLVEPIASGNAELALAVRDDGDEQTAGTRAALRIIGAVYRHRFADIARARAIDFPALIALGMRDIGDGFDTEMQVKAVRLGLRIAEVTVRHLAAADARTPTATERARAAGRVLFRILKHSTTR